MKLDAAEPSLPEIIDTHCHLTSKDLISKEIEIIERAREAGVTRLLTIACSVAEMQMAREFASRHENVQVAAGIHPHQAGEAEADAIDHLATAWQSGELLAAGEMGLDYHYDFSPRAIQQDVFKRQLGVARPTGLPIVIHSREAHDDTVKLLVEMGFDRQPVVFHCFSGTADEAADLRSHGWRASFTGIITFKNATGPRQACADTPIDQLMFETDAPYLSPEPVRRLRPNEPAHLLHTVRFAAELHNTPFEEFAKLTTANALSFYRWAD